MVKAVIRSVKIKMDDEAFWIIKSYMAKLRIRRWYIFMRIVADMLNEYLSNEEVLERYKTLARKYAEEYHRLKIEGINKEEETSGQTLHRPAGANHDTK